MEEKQRATTKYRKPLNIVLLIFWSALIFLGSSLPGKGVSSVSFWDFAIHKSVHLFEFAVLYILAVRTFKNKWVAFAYLMVFAASDEVHQSFVPGRTAKVRDVFIDGLGGLSGFLLCFLYRQNKHKK